MGHLCRCGSALASSISTHGVCNRWPQGNDDHVLSSELLATHKQMAHCRPSIAKGSQAYIGGPGSRACTFSAKCVTVTYNSCAGHMRITRNNQVCAWLPVEPVTLLAVPCRSA